MEKKEKKNPPDMTTAELLAETGKIADSEMFLRWHKLVRELNQRGISIASYARYVGKGDS